MQSRVLADSTLSEKHWYQLSKVCFYLIIYPLMLAMSAVGYSTDSELALYPTTLIQN